MGEDLPRAFGVLGPGAIPALSAYLSDEGNGLWARVAAAGSLQRIGARHPAARDECVATETRQLEQFARQDPTLNASLIADLIELKAVEAAPVIERAFRADQVDEMVVGDWEDVQVDFGLKERREKPRRPPPPGSADAVLDQIGGLLKRLDARPAPKVEFDAPAERASQFAASAAPKRKHHRKHKGQGAGR